jgi:hypothetical protein
MADGYTVLMCQRTGALVLVAGLQEPAGYDFIRWTAGTRQDGAQALQEVKATVCGTPLRRAPGRAWCRRERDHDGECW